MQEEIENDKYKEKKQKKSTTMFRLFDSFEELSKVKEWNDSLLEENL